MTTLIARLTAEARPIRERMAERAEAIQDIQGDLDDLREDQARDAKELGRLSQAAAEAVRDDRWLFEEEPGADGPAPGLPSLADLPEEEQAAVQAVLDDASPFVPEPVVEPVNKPVTNPEAAYAAAQSVNSYWKQP